MLTWSMPLEPLGTLFIASWGQRGCVSRPPLGVGFPSLGRERGGGKPPTPHTPVFLCTNLGMSENAYLANSIRAAGDPLHCILGSKGLCVQTPPHWCRVPVVGEGIPHTPHEPETGLADSLDFLLNKPCQSSSNYLWMTPG